MPEPMGPAQLRSWLRWVVPAAGFFAALELAAGVTYADVRLMLGGLVMVAFATTVWTVGARIGDRPTSGLAMVVVIALLVAAFAQAMLVPIANPTLLLVPFLAALLATSYARDHAKALIVLSGAASVLFAIAHDLIPMDSPLPSQYQTLLRAWSAVAGSWLGLVLLVELDSALSHALRAALRREREARAVFDNALDSIITIDDRGRILSWNPQAEATFGWPAAEVVGQPLSTTIVPPEMRESHEAGIERLRRSGEGRVLNQRIRLEAVRRDGVTIPVELAIVPMELDGATVYGGFVRDLSAEHAATERLASERQHRSVVAQALASLRAEDSLEETAAVLCRRISELADLPVVGLYAFPSPDEAVAIGLEQAPGLPVMISRPIAPRRAAYLRDRAVDGPWIQEWLPWQSDRGGATRWQQTGLRGSIYVPIEGRSGMVALIVAGTPDPISHDDLAQRLPVVVEFGAMAGAILAADLDARFSEGRLRAELAAVIGRREFDIVFQPVVDLQTDVAVGYESLTRFRDGTRPDVRFADAVRLEMGPALEFATARAAIVASMDLPAGRWISLNMSPSTVLDRRRMRRLLAGTDRPVVIELTEHAAVADYPAVSRAIEALGPRIRLAVDDAGAGYAGLRHLVELRAEIVKLDMRLVRDVDRDPARQALIAGMGHFAATSGCVLVAEGIETAEERATLMSLGIEVGQGYLLGRPAPVEAWRPRPSLRLLGAEAEEQAS